ncbi:hypothetical protein GGX14DRAFT_166592 [Mycena pura]|uniref:Secreted protein n=1 Tax=Mycena pura TaxID=153505 RepID=A0AAD6YBP7_9AGAR|nr:hypothetical protein GGX14DRAFT_166592 [Mycena pura]
MPGGKSILVVFALLLTVSASSMRRSWTFLNSSMASSVASKFGYKHHLVSNIIRSTSQSRSLLICCMFWVYQLN